jgi:hypothetical protein
MFVMARMGHFCFCHNCTPQKFVYLTTITVMKLLYLINSFLRIFAEFICLDFANLLNPPKFALPVPVKNCINTLCRIVSHIWLQANLPVAAGYEMVWSSYFYRK